MAVVIGTRPEAIKLAPVVLELRRRGISTSVVATGQHGEMVDSVLGLFGIAPDHELKLMRREAGLNAALGRAIYRIGALFDEIEPGAVIVQGDTTTAVAGAIAAFNAGVPVAHVEAGLRSHDLALPFPEEMHRRLITVVARWQFAPTEHAAEQLRAERATGSILVTGNTVVDAVNHILATHAGPPAGAARGQYLLATAHRRESWGDPIRNIALGLRDVLRAQPDLSVVFATHPNPKARGPVDEVLAAEPRAMVVDAIAYDEFLKLLRGATLAVTDSGGVQEEGPSLGVPVLVTRAVTERPEGIEAGAARIVGTGRARIRTAVLELLEHPELRLQMTAAGRSVYGDGMAASRIVGAIVGGDVAERLIGPGDGRRKLKQDRRLPRVAATPAAGRGNSLGAGQGQ
ncbi:MAG: UDP-N-acetylglucosamine 2-epimerase (non-hydrolyzing) [Chloroflexota bacterium]